MVSVMSIVSSPGSMTRRVVESSVEKSLPLWGTLLPASVLRSVDLPALVYPTIVA